MDNKKIDTPAEKIEDIFKKAIADPNTPAIYANGFITALGMGDTSILLQQNGKTIAILNLSYTVAKTLALKLGGLIKDLEIKTGNTIMTTDNLSQQFETQKGTMSC